LPLSDPVTAEIVSYPALAADVQAGQSLPLFQRQNASKSFAEIGVPSLQTASGLIFSVTFIGLSPSTFGSSASSCLFHCGVESGLMTIGAGSRPASTWPVSYVLPSLSNVFQLGSFFSTTTVSVPPGFVFPLLQVLGLVSHSENPAEEVSFFSPPDVPHAARANAAISPTAATLPVLRMGTPRSASRLVAAASQPASGPLRGRNNDFQP
jgi:hypothetical protein